MKRHLIRINELEFPASTNSSARLESREGRVVLSAFVAADPEALANSDLPLDAYFDAFGVSVVDLPIQADATRYSHSDALESRHHVWAFLCHDHEGLERFVLDVHDGSVSFEGSFLLHDRDGVVTSMGISFERFPLGALSREDLKQ